MAWTTPHDWVAGEPISAVKLNELAEQLRSLYARPSAVVSVRGAGTNITSVSTTITAVDVAQFNLTLPCTGAAVEFSFSGAVSHTVASTLISFDVLYDGLYLSSGTATPVTNNLWGVRVPAITVFYPFTFTHILPAGSLTAGIHSFALMWRGGAAGTNTLALNGYVAQFSAKEI